MSTRHHPAPFSPKVLAQFQHQLEQRVPHGARLLDPFAGVGRIHMLEHYRTIGVELEPEWAEKHADTEVGNALHLRWRRHTFDVLATSPCFGNRMADHHNAKDDSERHTYKHALGRDPSPESAAILQWGDEYREFHIQAILEANRVLKKKAWWLLNMSDHWRTDLLQPVTAWWIGALTDCGWEWVDADPVITQRQKHGANRKRAQQEWVLCFERSPVAA